MNEAFTSNVISNVHDAPAAAVMDANTPSAPPIGTETVANTTVFFHPDLGIGGAERLVVDAAVGLQNRGHKVVIFTNHCDPTHCFDECRDGTLDVRVRGNSIVPPSILSRLTILCAILRHIHLLLTIHLTGELAALGPRAFIVDQLSAGLPLMRFIAPDVPVLFYCHFPDLLLAQGRQSAVKRLYRVPFDWLEEWSMGFARAVAVNSNFTRSIVGNTWPGLQKQVPTKVVYPCVDTHKTRVAAEDDEAKNDEAVVAAGKKLILSINRFERKKDIGLAIKAFARIPDEQRHRVRLVLAGGYDPRVSENVLYHTELQALATSLSLSHHTVTPSKLSPIAASLSPTPPGTQVLFLLSVPNTLKSALLGAARLLVYTPANEHFGIVPLEAMLSRVPVLAANTGGPVETIADGETGWLRDPVDVPAWTDVMVRSLTLSDEQLAAMGAAGQRRVEDLFGRDKMAQTLDETLDQMASRAAKDPPRMSRAAGLGILAVFIAACAVSAAWFAF